MTVFDLNVQRNFLYQLCYGAANHLVSIIIIGSIIIIIIITIPVTNATTSKNCKISKYKNLKHNLISENATYHLAHYTVEVTSLGFSDISDFCSFNLVTDKMPVHVEQSRFRSVISTNFLAHIRYTARETQPQTRSEHGEQSV